MSDAEELFGALGHMVNENTSDEGIDIVNVFVALVDALKQNPEMDIETWEVFRLGINNSVAIMNNLVDEEIARLRNMAPSLTMVMNKMTAVAKNGIEFKFVYDEEKKEVQVFKGEMLHMTIVDVEPEDSTKEMINFLESWNQANPT